MVSVVVTSSGNAKIRCLIRRTKLRTLVLDCGIHSSSAHSQKNRYAYQFFLFNSCKNFIVHADKELSSHPCWTSIMNRFLCSGRMLGGSAILLSTIIILIVFVNPPQTRILHSSSPQTVSPTHNSSSPWNPSDVRCSGLPDTAHIQVVVKTGSNIIYDKLPTQLLTALRCCQDPLIFADSEQDIGPYHVYDVLANVNETVKATHPDFAYYRTIKDYLSSGRDIRLLRTSRQAAWDLDKYKFIHMLVETWERRPGHDWYVFVEADTYLFWGNLVQWLARMDPAKPLYLGSAATFQSEEFAHGGSGVILSREAMKRVLDGDADLAARYDERMHDEIYGDYVLMKALKEKGVELSNKWPMMQGEKQNTLPFGPGPNTGSRHGCQPLITMHSVTPVDVNAMWNYEQRRKHPQVCVSFIPVRGE